MLSRVVKGASSLRLLQVFWGCIGKSDARMIPRQETEETSRALKWRVFLRLQRLCLDLRYARVLVAVRRSQADRAGQSRPPFASLVCSAFVCRRCFHRITARAGT